MQINQQYMRRALLLASHGEGNASPNPMVGAVIVHNGRIIGEGYHRCCGEGHAEVNAIASVSGTDRPLLKESTMYVTLEPCSHYGKTPPCAKLIIDTGIPRVVVGAVDPFEKVAGRGIKMLRDNGVDVTTGLLADECQRLNRKFFTAHSLGRPFVTLKWAQSTDGWMDNKRDANHTTAYRFSTPLTTLFTARLRSLHDGIITSAATVNADNPRLNVREWDGRNPKPIIIDRRGIVNPNASLLSNPETLLLSSTKPNGFPESQHIQINQCAMIDGILKILYGKGITSVLIEAGSTMLNAFIEANIWDEARIEISPVSLGDNGSSLAPSLNLAPHTSEQIGTNRLLHYHNTSRGPV